MIARRNFLAGVFAAGMAPAIVRADSLMRIVAPRKSPPGYKLYNGIWVVQEPANRHVVNPNMWEVLNGRKRLVIDIELPPHNSPRTVPWNSLLTQWER